MSAFDVSNDEIFQESLKNKILDGLLQKPILISDFINEVQNRLKPIAIVTKINETSPVYKRLKEADPDARICVFSATNLDVPEFRTIYPSFEDRYLIKKPILMSSLVQRINSVITLCVSLGRFKSFEVSLYQLPYQRHVLAWIYE
jgi:hypothetical protein